MPYRDQDHDRLHPGEYPDEPSEGDLASCPSCRAAIYDDSERCPACGYYLEEASSHKPLWLVLGLLLCLAMAVGWVVWG